MERDIQKNSKSSESSEHAYKAMIATSGVMLFSIIGPVFPPAFGGAAVCFCADLYQAYKVYSIPLPEKK